MLPRKERVGTKLFDSVMKQGRNYRSSHFSLKVINLKTPEKSRISVVVPKKVAKLAVTRNRLKRQITAFIQVNKLISSSGFASVLFIQVAFPVFSEDIQQEIVQLIKNLS